MQLLPRIDGFEFLVGLRRIPGMFSVPVVFLTTSGLEQDVLAYRRSSASMYVEKPDTFGEIQIRHGETHSTIITPFISPCPAPRHASIPATSTRSSGPARRC